MLALALTLALSQAELTPPPPPPPVELTPSDVGTSVAPPDAYRQPGTQPTLQAPSRRGRVTAGITLLSLGHVTSIVNTTVYWLSDGVRAAGWGALIGLPLGIAGSVIPLVGPAIGILVDVSMTSATAFFPLRMAINLVSLAAQITGFVLLVTMPRTPKAPKRDIFAVSGFGVAPVPNGGAVMSLGGTFDFP